MERPIIICEELTASERRDYLADLASAYRDGELELADLGEMHAAGQLSDAEIDELVNGDDDEPSDTVARERLNDFAYRSLARDGFVEW